MNTKRDAIAALKVLDGFICKDELHALGSGMRSEEKEFFFDKLVEMAGIVSTMPKTYEQDDKGDQAIVYLHYFNASQDWYITEKDMETPEEPGQHQAFGYADLGGYGAEMGYISIVELVKHGVELDLYFKPQTLAEIKAKKAA